MNDHGLFSDSQSGFLWLFYKSMSSQKNTNDWYSGLGLGELVGIVFIDQTRHLILWITKSSAASFPSMVYSSLGCLGLNPIFSNRKQFCRVNGVESETGDIEVRVPHGSCLSPLLFLIYINHLPLLSKIVMSPCVLMMPVFATNLMI